MVWGRDWVLDYNPDIHQPLRMCGVVGRAMSELNASLPTLSCHTYIYCMYDAMYMNIK